ncbi:murein L,D-transpeptidase [Flavobacterium sp.]|uniref:L,D-transpeptidase family protein n=1 Tax=Flavobacterium sp. TaxID=239 RepID=UPI0035295867
MLKKLLYIFTVVVIIYSCKKETQQTSDAEKVFSSQVQFYKIPENTLKLLNDSLQLYYKKNNNEPLWNSFKNRQDLINEINNCFADGLNPDDYYYEKIKLLETNRNQLSENELIAYDTLLTSAYKKLATHLYSGKLNPTKLYNDWDLGKKRIALSDTLINTIVKENIPLSFKNLRPNHSIYIALKKSLALLESYPNDTFKKISIAKKIELNDTVADVISIKKRLRYWNDYTVNDSVYTSVYDSITYLAIKKFQKRHGLKPDGVIGKGTIEALNYSKEERKHQIIANLERWKWFPRNFGNEYVIVNLPDYSLNYVINNDTVSHHTVVVGKKSRRTPILISKISNLVFNPTWTVPPTIIKEDLTPAATKNRNYFNRNNMVIINRSGDTISPANWNPELAKSYRYVQRPSANNSLGLVKFNFPNKRLVYLHDTNHRNYFSREDKALSSGCVRVENPFNLAEKILVQEDKEFWNKATIDSILIKKKTKSVAIKHAINVYLLYWTSWSNKDELIFRDDIYALDEKLYKALRN